MLHTAVRRGALVFFVVREHDLGQQPQGLGRRDRRLFWPWLRKALGHGLRHEVVEELGGVALAAHRQRGASAKLAKHLWAVFRTIEQEGLLLRAEQSLEWMSMRFECG